MSSSNSSCRTTKSAARLHTRRAGDGTQSKHQAGTLSGVTAVHTAQRRQHKQQA